jgi:TPP-dependent pyruvate/acetoin dehydrogenase alpha subunit
MRTYQFALNSLADPSEFNGELDLSNTVKERLYSFMESMLRIRLAELRLADGRRDGLIGGPVHLGVGQEAVAVGVSAALRASDRVFGAHRSHSHLLALGASLEGLFAEVLGRDTGHSRGMGGSMHLWDKPNGFYGSVPIVAGTVPLAVGAGLAAKLQNSDDVSIAYMGDGAVEEGIVHESLNLARIQDVPVIFIVENNLFASHMHISSRQPCDSTARFAVANSIPHRLVDGNDVIAVANAAAELIEAARLGRGPGFIEAVTFRWYGHVDWREDIDVGVHRSVEELNKWRQRDPIRRLKDAMVNANFLKEKKAVALEDDLRAEVENAWAAAIRAPYPDERAIMDRVYYKNNETQII